MGKLKTIKSIWDYVDEAFDPKYDTTKVGRQAIKDMQVRSDITGPNRGQEISLADLEGHPYVATQSDRLDANRLITGINDVDFNEAIRLPGGQGYMFEQPDKAWASFQGPAQQVIDVANYGSRETGKQSILLPWRMAPTGGDHAHATGQTILAHAQSGLGRSDKKKFDNFIKNLRSTPKQGNELIFPDWPGVDSPKAMEYYNNSPSTSRKTFINKIGKATSNKKALDGMNVLRSGQARAAVSDIDQLNAIEGGFQNVGVIAPNRNLVGNTNNSTYNSGVVGHGLGTLKENQQRATIWDFMTPSMNIVDIDGKPFKGLGKQELVRKKDVKASNKLRPYQMKAYGGVIDDKLLRRLEDKGLLAGGGASAGLLSGIEGESQTPAQDYEGDLMGGMDFSKVNSEQRPFLPTIAEYAKSMLRGAATGSLDTADSIRGLGEKMGFIPDTSEYMPDAAREQARQSMRDRIPEYERKYTSDEEDSFFKQVGAFFGL